MKEIARKRERERRGREGGSSKRSGESVRGMQRREHRNRTSWIELHAGVRRARNGEGVRINKGRDRHASIYFFFDPFCSGGTVEETSSEHTRHSEHSTEDRVRAR